MLSLDSHYKPLYVYAETRSRYIDVPYQQTSKRVFDVCLSLFVCLLVLSWMIPLIGLLIKLGSKGPVLYIQKRTGYRGSWFYCFKFRTMRCGPATEFRQTTKNDSRITPIGRFLRRTNLDEMPQFLNVLRGDMSVVGPRPHALEHSAQFWNTMPEYRRRYRVRPGITGLAQVRGCRGEVNHLMKMKHRVRYDRLYNRKKSAGLDMWICWMTVSTMLKGDRNAW
ncbi:sugar transferase [Spirosoma luteum]|uniref:sugar transferase n=1 Tax=Spirosoma luteum TaxID=431553 RepID=UPI0003634FC6|nr:sugar transferase [Spirosoma luteum]